ncbi:MAG: WG repeat-containing protein [Oscillospiraceae bacterium]|nr:WG repeat-containing protein [Oscillospiraceae bacterium]
MNDKTKYTLRPINGEYDYVGEFREGVAFVRNNYEEFRVGYIDKTGEIVIPLDYYGRFTRGEERPEFVHFPYFSEGFAVLMDKEGKFGFVNKENRVVIAFEYDSAYAFEGGCAAVQKGGKWGAVDGEGNVVIPFEYDEVSSLGEGFMSTKKGDTYSDSPIYDSANDFIEGLVAVQKGGKWGYIDETGEIIIPIEYDSVGRFNEGLSAVQKDGKWGILQMGI